MSKSNGGQDCGAIATGKRDWVRDHPTDSTAKVLIDTVRDA